jgi:hypothetical protein
MYTTTFPRVFSGPVTTVSVITGVACCFAQEGSLAMSIGRIFGGVPVKVTFPVMPPALASCRAMAPVIEDASTTRANEEMYVVRIGKPCLAMGS